MLSKLKKRLPTSLFKRTLLILVLPTVLAQLIAVYIFYERHWESVSRNMALSLAGEISYIVREVEKNGATDLSEFEDALAIKSIEIGKFPMHRGANWQKVKYPLFTNALNSRINNNFQTFRSYDENLFLTRVQIGDEWLEIQTSSKRLFNSTTYIFIFWMLGSTTLLTCIAVMFLKNQIRPVIRLARFADNFGRGHEQNSSFRAEGALEVRQATAAFLKMRSRIRRYIRQRTEMLAGISHDLRTPLTRMKLELELLKGKFKDFAFDGISNDINEMQRMIDSYIDFVLSDEEEESREVNLAEILRDVAAKFTAQGAKIDVADLPDCALEIKENLITRAISNLVQNATKYATATKIAMLVSAKSVIITIEDNGSGIPEAERELVFRPFYRIEKSRNAETGGSGLGLAIVQDIINGHGGTVELDAPEMGGLLVKVKLPR